MACLSEQGRARHRACNSFFLGLLLLATACGRDRASPERSDAVGADDRAGTVVSAEGRVTLTPEQFAAARIDVVAVTTERNNLEHSGFEVPGHVEYDPRRVALASPRTAGRLEALLAVEGDLVSDGQPLALVLSPEYLTAQGDLAQAGARARLLAGGPDSAGAAAIATAAGRRLARLGVSPEEVERLAAGGEPRDLLAVYSPLAGTVMRSHLLAGAAVEPGTPLMEVADLSVVDVVAQVPERSLPLIREGALASVSIVALPGWHVDGTVERLRGSLDPETRTMQAVIHVTNRGGRLRPGMFAAVRIEVPHEGTAVTREAEAVLLIPPSAVVNDGEDRIVFVEVGERTYERREVRVEPHASGALGADSPSQLRVREGLRPGERVVSRGAFVLKSELRKAPFGEEES